MADKDKTVEYAIIANVDRFISAMAQAAGASKETAQKIDGSFSALVGTFNRVSSVLAGVTALLAGGAAFKAAMDRTIEWGGAVGQLSRQLGVTTGEAAALKVATERLGIGTEVVTAASDKLARQMVGNASAFEALGIHTKNANGAWRTSGDVLPEVVEKLRAITNPMQQTIAGQALFGKGWSEIRPILKLTSADLEEARQKVKDLHLDIDPARVRQYKESMNDLKLVTTSLSVQVGGALLPVFTRFATYLGGEGKTFIEAFMKVLQTVAAALQTIMTVAERVMSTIGGLAAAAVAALHGNFSDARAILGEITADNAAAASKIKDIWKHAYDDAKPPSSGGHPDQDTPALDLKGDKAGKGDKSRMGAWDEALTEAKVYYEQTHGLRQMSKAEEIQYWEDIRANNKLTNEEAIALNRRVATLKLEQMREDARQQKEIEAEKIGEAKRVGDDRITAARQEAEALYNQKLISHNQLLALEKDLEAQQYAIDRQALQDKLRAAENDVVAQQKVNDEIEDLARKHAMKMRGIDLQMEKDSEKGWASIFDKVGKEFGQFISTMVTGTHSIGQAFTRLGQQMLTSMLESIARQEAAQAAAWVRKMVMTRAASSQTIAAKNAEASATVPAEAAQAAGGAASAMASIPYVGPVLAAAAFASIMALVKGGLSSAAGGFDIPTGVNPLTQLHEREMVLPASLADSVRNMTSDGGGGDVHLHVHAIDVQGDKDYFRRNSHALAPGLRTLARNFAADSQ